jgi:acyl transferase domain-containing protein/acyl carrier protein
MALQAIAPTSLAHSHELTDFIFKERLLLQTDAPALMQVLLLPDKDGAFSFNVYSQQNEDWILHASAVLAPKRNANELPALNRAALQKQGLEQMTTEEFYQTLWQRGVQYGPSFRGVEAVWRKNGEAWGRIKLPEPLPYESMAYQIHPAFLDASLQVLAATLETSAQQKFYLPIGCQCLRFHSRPEHQLWSHVLLRTEAAHDTNIIEADIRLWDDADHVVAELLGFRLQRMVKRVRRELPPNTWLYHVRWQAAKWPEHSSRATLGGKRWIIFADQKGVAQNLATQLEARGDRCQLAYCDWDRIDGETIRQRIEEIMRAAPSPLYGIIHLWSLDALPSVENSNAALDMAQALGCNSVLRLAQTLAQRAAESPRLWLVTCGAQSVQDGERPAVEHSPLWGLGKVISYELPEFKCTRIDLDPANEVSETAKLLLKQLFVEDQEDQIAFRGNVRYVPRLLPYALSNSFCATTVTLRPENTYLITGGLGALGLMVAQWMIAQGARHLVLMGRSEPSAAANAVVHEMRQQGAEIIIVKSDVADQARLATVFAQIEKDLPPLRGVVHAAGVLDDGALVNLDSSRMASVMTPKVHGTWNLHLATMNLPLDFFILFSSAVSALGSPGQGNYAAASTFLDAMAHYRFSRGLPAISINWGPWAEVGLAAEATAQLKEHGASTQHLVKVITREQGLEILEQLLTAPPPQVTVLPFDLSNLLELYPAAAGMPFFAEVGGKTTHVARLYARPKLRQEYVAPRNDIERKLAELWRQTLHIDRVGIHDSFFELGGDSVLAAQIVTLAQKTFGIRINLQDAFKAFTIKKLAEMLEAALIDKVEEMSENEAAQLLAEDISK